MQLAAKGPGWLMADAVALRTTLAHDHLSHRHLLMRGVNGPIHLAAPVAGYAQDRFGTGQITSAMPSWHRAIARSQSSARVAPGRCRCNCRQDGLVTSPLGGGFDHEGSHVSGAAGADDDRGGCVLASSRPFDAQPLAQLGFGSARDVVIFLVAAISAKRRHWVATTGRCMTIRKQPSGRFYPVLKLGRSYVAGRTFDTSGQPRPGWSVRGRRSREASIRGRVERQYEPCRFGWTSGKHSVSAKTCRADAALPRLVPTALGALSLKFIVPISPVAIFQVPYQSIG